MPVYVLLTALLFADRPLLGGIAFAACYLLGAVAALAERACCSGGRSCAGGRGR